MSTLSKEDVAVMIKAAKEEFILAAIERMYLGLPDVMGALMANHAVALERSKKIYADYPEFKGHEDSVKSVLEQSEFKNPLLEFDKLLKEAVPDIRKRIDTIKSLNLDTVSANPDRQFQPIDSPKINNPHGVI